MTQTANVDISLDLMNLKCPLEVEQSFIVWYYSHMFMDGPSPLRILNCVNSDSYHEGVPCQEGYGITFP